ncbi:hypothetical protein [Amycolatopsis australiensis]|uniref:Uncharacterized protein n=1 Tax=Amycolatopsis australiensis TaxID=546364 RepID=A0A1K1LLF9_9PSEU|nr:hypothetical protein [Amycolatopsis australiensis]SFW11683.1 hypothetical protein SAMN04489730_0047 [Amycolatopsis australiensis]
MLTALLNAFNSLDSTARFVVVLVLVVVLYGVSGLIWPHTSCSHCSGGRHHSPTGKNWRHCGKCGGSGRKVRAISRLLGRSRDD